MLALRTVLWILMRNCVNILLENMRLRLLSTFSPEDPPSHWLPKHFFLQLAARISTEPFSFVEVLKARAFCRYSKLTIYGISFQHRKFLRAPRHVQLTRSMSNFICKVQITFIIILSRIQTPFFNVCGRECFPSASAMLFSRPTKIFMLVYPLHLCEIFSRVKAIFCML